MRAAGVDMSTFTETRGWLAGSLAGHLLGRLSGARKVKGGLRLLAISVTLSAAIVPSAVAQRAGVAFTAQSVPSDTSPVALSVDGLYRMEGERLQILVTRVRLNARHPLEIDIRALRFHLYPRPAGVLPAAPTAVTHLVDPRTLVTPTTLLDTLAIQLPWGYDRSGESRLYISLLDSSRQVIGRAESSALRVPD